MRHAIISIHPEYAAEIIGGTKKIEVRTRPLLVAPGACLWIYATLPIGEIQAAVRVTSTYRMSPSRAWNEFGDEMSLSRTAYRTYVNGSEQVSLLKLGKVTALLRPITLNAIRRSHRGFQPPQFIKCVGEEEGVYKLLADAMPELFR